MRIVRERNITIVVRIENKYVISIENEAKFLIISPEKLK